MTVITEIAVVAACAVQHLLIFADGWQIIYGGGLATEAVEQVERRAVMLTLVAELVIGEERAPTGTEGDIVA